MSSNDESPQVAKKIDLKEAELAKAKRTVFIGNVPNTVITSKKIYKEFKHYFELENTHVESIRFRSISFEEALPRKVAFVQQKFHHARESVNAYMVYKDSKSIPQVCRERNGTVFQERHLRVDSVSNPSPQDNKRCVFVGNLDFEEDEESLWNHFESCGKIEYVRLVRDSKTNMGKGFAYIQFADFQSVNKALLLNGKPILSAHKRKLRVSRCKTIKTTTAHASNNNLTESQKTKLGRAKKLLGKADRATAGKLITIEGLRAEKTDKPSVHLQKKKKQRSKTGRVTKRSLAFKKSQQKLSK